MENKIIACVLYENITILNRMDKNNLICNLFKITKSTLYRWINEYHNTIDKINTKIIFDFKSKIITKEIVCFVIYFILSNINISLKKIKKELNKKFINNFISLKHIKYIIHTNNHILNKSFYNKKNYKLNSNIQLFITNSINKNNCLTANDISNLIQNKFNVKISLTTIYNFFKKNNYVYKKTTININPYSYEEQKNQLINVHDHLTNKYNNIILDNITKEINDKSKFLINMENDIIKMNKSLKEDTNIIYYMCNEIKKINNLLKQETKIIKNESIISIDEMSIITNRASTTGWTLKNKECIISIPYLKPNERYSLLMATSNKKIIKYYLVKGSIKTDDFINFMDQLNKENPNNTYLIDNASIHINKKTINFYKNNNLHIVFNAPYQSKFNPIEMVFSLLRKKLNKKIVKSKKEIEETIKLFKSEITEKILTNIYNHSIKLLKEYLKI